MVDGCIVMPAYLALVSGNNGAPSSPPSLTSTPWRTVVQGPLRSRALGLALANSFAHVDHSIT
eukprot:3542311-Alexandrium_andersonii.AAC.1